MELRHLRYFLAVASHGGFGRAALVLRVAQPALSRQIRSLENELETELLVRSHRGVELTLAGSVLQRAAAAILLQMTQAVDRARLSGQGLSGRCRIGAGKPSIWSGMIPNVVIRLSQTHADIELEIIEAEGPEQWRGLLEGRLDLGMGLAPLSTETALVSEPILDSVIDSALIAEDHPLASRRHLTPEDLAPHPLLSFETLRHLELYRDFLPLLDRAGIRSERRFTYPTMQSVWSAVAAGRGWALTSSRWDGRGPDGTVVRSVSGLEIPFHLCLVSRRDEERSHVMSVMEAFRSVPARTDDIIEKPPVETVRRGKRKSADILLQSLELRHLRYFKCVVDEGGFGRAAERLGITQPGLSRQVKNLESAIGVELVKRIPRGVRVTAAGETLRSEVNLVERCVSQLYAQLRAAHRGMHHQCMIGSVTTTVTARLIPQVLRLLDTSSDGLEPSVTEMATPEQPQALREGLIDVGICHAYPDLAQEQGLNHARLLDDVIDCALLSQAHPLAHHPSLEPEELSNIPFLFMPRAFHPGFYDLVFGALRDIGLSPLVEREYAGLHTVWSIAGRGAGWGLGFRSHRSQPPLHLIAVPIRGLSLPWGLDVLWRREDCNAHAAEVVDAIREAGSCEFGSV